MKVQITPRCACGFEQAVIIKKPSHFEPTLSTYECSTCGSYNKVFVKKRTGGKTQGEVGIRVITVRASKDLQAMIEEENAKRIEEVVNEKVTEENIP